MMTSEDERLYERQLDPPEPDDEEAKAAEAFAERAWIPDVSDEEADEWDSFSDDDEVDQ